MRAGSLRYRMSLQRKKVQRDAVGGEIVSWVEFRKLWGGIRSASGRELQAANALNHELTHVVTGRWPSEDGVPTAADRIKFGCRVFSVTYVINWDERSREMVVGVTELLNRG